jgi:hypothetical protein
MREDLRLTDAIPIPPCCIPGYEKNISEPHGDCLPLEDGTNVNLCHTRGPTPAPAQPTPAPTNPATPPPTPAPYPTPIPQPGACDALKTPSGRWVQISSTSGSGTVGPNSREPGCSSPCLGACTIVHARIHH